MPEKSPQKPAGKKPGKSLKEKREAKTEKKESRTGLGHYRARRKVTGRSVLLGGH